MQATRKAELMLMYPPRRTLKHHARRFWRQNAAQQRLTLSSASCNLLKESAKQKRTANLIPVLLMRGMNPLS